MIIVTDTEQIRSTKVKIENSVNSYESSFKSAMEIMRNLADWQGMDMLEYAVKAAVLKTHIDKVIAEMRDTVDVLESAAKSYEDHADKVKRLAKTIY